MFAAKRVTAALKGVGVPGVLAPALAHLVGAASGYVDARGRVTWTSVREIRVDTSMPDPERVGHVHAEVGSWWADAHVHAEAGELRVYVRWCKGAYATPTHRVCLAFAVRG